MNFSMMLQRKLLALAVTLSLIGGVSIPRLVSAQEQTYPSRVITLVVPYAPGGQTDLMGRILAEKLAVVFKKPVVVENRGGAAGSLAARMVSRAAPDGYTLIFGSGGPMSINPVLRKGEVGYDPVADFTPVAYVANSPNLIAANPSFPAKTVAELIAMAKAQPGKLNIGTTQGSGPDMMSRLFRYQAGIDYLSVPYPSAAPLINDVLGGHVPVLIDGVIAVQQHIASNKLIAIAISSAQRLSTMPTVPTVAETLPGFESNSWFSVFAPARTPHEIVLKLNAGINEVLSRPDVKERYIALGAIIVGGPPETLRDHLAAELVQWKKLVQDTGMKTE